MVDVIFDINFKEKYKKIKDRSLKERIIKQLNKIRENPEVGKPMRYTRKGTRELYIPPYRLSYMIKTKDLIYILDLYHKNEQ